MKGEHFLRCCKSGSIVGARKYIENGGDINYRNKKNRNGLMYACQSSYKDSNLDLVQLLLKEKNCELNRCDVNGTTAWEFSTFSIAENKNELIMDVLIRDQRLDFTLKSPGTPVTQGGCILDHLIRSRSKKSIEMIKFLLFENKNFNISMNDAFVIYGNDSADITTPLILSVKKRNFELTKLLIENENCDLNIEDYYGKTALMHFCYKGEKAIKQFEFLINNKRCDLNLKHEIHGSALRILCKKGNREMAKMLLDTNRCVVEEIIGHENCQDLIVNHFANRRNKIGTLLISIHLNQKTKENPLNILPKELIHLILSYVYPLAPQTKYCKKLRTIFLEFS